MPGKTVLVLGGGIGGVNAALEARRRLSRDHRVSLVDSSGKFTFQGTYLWTLSGSRQTGDFTRDLGRLKKRGIYVQHATVESINLDRNRVETSTGGMPYDYLVVATGAEATLDTIPGLANAAFNLYDPISLAGLKEAIADFDAGRIVIAVAPPPYKCPIAPYEAALILDAVLRRKGVRDRVQLEMYAAESGPVPQAGPEVAKTILDFLASRDIAFNGGHVMESVDSSAKKLSFSNGAATDFDLLAVVPPHRTAPAIGTLPIANAGGWIPVDTHRLTTQFANVFAVGDVASVELPAGGNLPKAAIFAKAAAQTVARNIAAEIAGGQQEDFHPSGGCFLDTGDGRSFLVGGEFYAFPKPRISIEGPSRRIHFQKVWLERTSLHAV